MKTNESMRKILSVLLTFCMVLSCIPTTAFATTCEHTPGEPVVETVPASCYEEGFTVTTVDCINPNCFDL